jgi:hypothetical protein
MHTEIHASSGIRTYDPSVPAGETVHSLDGAATVIGTGIPMFVEIQPYLHGTAPL